uniref:Uncharacterized protein n=1 Tax=Arundo donax TaxID=35708 RepID=A0A0A9HEX0_ARUDO
MMSSNLLCFVWNLNACELVISTHIRQSVEYGIHTEQK